MESRLVPLIGLVRAEEHVKPMEQKDHRYARGCLRWTVISSS
jgi:hypothetical protein